MKKLIVSIFSGICFLFPSCADYLNVSDELASNLTIEEVFENVNYTKRWHSGVFNCISEYSNIFWKPDGFGNPWACLSGETTINWGDGKTEAINGFNASNAKFHRWTNMYRYIRQAHIFLNNAKPIGNPMDNQSLTEEDMKRMKSEIKFFIGYAYFSLFELYGPIPVVKDVISDNSTDLDFERASVDETITYIDGLFQEVLDENALPQTLRSINEGTGENVENLNEMVRPTRAVVLAMRAKLWVYAASKLFNGGYDEALEKTNKDGKKLFPEFNAEKWKTAKTHLEAFLRFTEENGYELFKVYNKDGSENPSMSVYKVFQDYNKEIIWATGKTSMNSVTSGEHLDRRCMPRDIFDGFCGIGLSQQMVDAFFTKNGLDIHEDSEYKEAGFTDIENPCAYKKPQIDKGISNMYVNREPRFYHAVTYHGKSWHIQPKAGYVINMDKGGNNDNFVSGREHYSGYLLYKRCNQEMLNTGSYLKTYARPSILLRLADFYLYYAEVCNEIDPANPDIIKYIDLVRQRAGIPGYRELHNNGKKTNLIGNYVQQAKAIRQERQVELLTEGQRYFDIRRWMICGEGEEADRSVYWGMNVDGVKTIAPGTAGSFFNRKIVQTHNWKKAMYLYPIPHDEIEKSTKLVQNPSW